MRVPTNLRTEQGAWPCHPKKGHKWTCSSVISLPRVSQSMEGHLVGLVCAFRALNVKEVIGFEPRGWKINEGLCKEDKYYLKGSDGLREKLYCTVYTKSNAICNLILYLYKRLSGCSLILRVNHLNLIVHFLFFAKPEPIKGQRLTISIFVNLNGFER